MLSRVSVSQIFHQRKNLAPFSLKKIKFGEFCGAKLSADLELNGIESRAVSRKYRRKSVLFKQIWHSSR